MEKKRKEEVKDTHKMKSVCKRSKLIGQIDYWPITKSTEGKALINYAINVYVCLEGLIVVAKK